MSDIELAGQQGEAQEGLGVPNAFSEVQELRDEENIEKVSFLESSQEEQDNGFLCTQCKNITCIIW